MAEIRITREHTLSREQARALARDWAAKVEKKFELQCQLDEGPEQDCLKFSRSGLRGSMLLRDGRIEVQAQLGLMFGAFAGQIEREVGQQLDEALARRA